MVNIHLKNTKLRERGVNILEKTTDLDRTQASKLLASAGHSVPVALVMAKAGVTRAAATAALKKSRGHVRKAIELAKP
jgi:N-acetylmuramic acid 6-phosphate etherase